MKTGMWSLRDHFSNFRPLRFRLRRVVICDKTTIDPLYTSLKKEIDEKITSLLKPAHNMTGVDLLRFYADQWKPFKRAARLVDGVFSYFNRQAIEISKLLKLHELYEEKEPMEFNLVMIITSWTKILTSTGLDKKLGEAVIDGFPNNEELLEYFIKSYKHLCKFDQVQINSGGCKRFVLYERFEETLLAEWEGYNREMLNKLYQSPFQTVNQLQEYLKEVVCQLKEAPQMCQAFKPLVTDTCETKLIKTAEKVLIHNELTYFQLRFEDFLKNSSEDDVIILFELCARVDGGLAKLDGLGQTALEQFIKERFDAIDSLKDGPNTDPRSYIKALSEVCQRYRNLFKNAAGFMRVLDIAAATFINKNSLKNSGAIHTLVEYCDQLLRKASKAMAEIDLEEALCDIMIIFKYIEDWDTFSKYYKKRLSKRLISGTSASEEAEKSLIGKLTLYCGVDDTNRMLEMVDDIQISEEYTSDFQQNMDSRGVKSPDLSIMILNTRAWPAMPVINFQLPRELGQCCENFKQFYNEKYSGRKLAWLSSQLRGELQCNGYQQKKIFVATAAQMAVLILFNDSLKYSAAAIEEGLEMEKKLVAQTVAGLVKAKVLLGSEGEYADEAEFELDLKFKSPKTKLVLCKVGPLKKSQDAAGNVDEDRKPVIDARIVQIMKDRKSLSHKLLISEVLKLSNSFQPKIDLIKKCIEQLIEREYIQRNKEQRDIYEYIA